MIAKKHGPKNQYTTAVIQNKSKDKEDEGETNPELLQSPPTKSLMNSMLCQRCNISFL